MIDSQNHGKYQLSSLYPNQEKNSLNPKNYRLVAPTSCLCKTMERMANKSLVWFIKSTNLITNSHCDFRSQRSTMDHVVRFEISVREANKQKQYFISFFDLEKAYEIPWKCIMNELDTSNLKLWGRLPDFIKNFLSDRQFRVWIWSTLSNFHNQKEDSLMEIYCGWPSSA